MQTEVISSQDADTSVFIVTFERLKEAVNREAGEALTCIFSQHFN